MRWLLWAICCCGILCSGAIILNRQMDKPDSSPELEHTLSPDYLHRQYQEVELIVHYYRGWEVRGCWPSRYILMDERTGGQIVTRLATPFHAEGSNCIDFGILLAIQKNLKYRSTVVDLTFKGKMISTFSCQFKNECEDKFTFEIMSTAPAEEGEPFLQVKTKASTFNVADKKAIYCEGKFLKDDLEWYSPSGDKIPPRSSTTKRVYVEHRSLSNSDATFLALMIQRTLLNDTGTYTCKSGDLSDTIDIFVGEKVVIKESEEDYMGEEENYVDLTCQAKGTPVPEIQWYNANSYPIVSDEKYRITYKNKSFVSTLRIRNLNHLDPGTYICKATQEKMSHFAEKACHLTVQHKPYIMNEFSEREVYAIQGEWKNITCKAIAYPAPVFTWSKQSPDFNEEIKGETEDFKIITEEVGTNSVLMLHINNDTLDAQYKCTVENPKGRKNIIFHVSLGNKPDPPTAVSVVATTASNITFDISCPSCIFYRDDGLAPKPENLTVLGFVFQLVRHMEGYVIPYWVNATEYRFDIAENNGTTFTVEGLDKSTEYHVRVATRNLAGLSDWFYLEGYPKTTDGAAALAQSMGLLIIALIISLSY